LVFDAAGGALNARVLAMPITAIFSPATFTLSIVGTEAADAITIQRTAAGRLHINNDSVPITSGPATVANTDLIVVSGLGGSDTITLDEANGALPAANLFGGGGRDTLTGGSNGDSLFGEGNDDTLEGKGGNDILQGGTGHDILIGGDGDDQMFGEAGDDRMIWNPGDDSDLMEGGDGTDTAEVNGGGGAEVFTVTTNGTRVRFDRLDPAPFMLDIGTTENLIVNMGGGNDSFSTTGNLAALISITVDGGAGNDTILGSNGADVLIGGEGNDFIDGQQGNDTVSLGTGDDVFQWDPGDGNDTVNGQGGSDTLLFNASAGNEIVDIVADGAHVSFTRNLGNVVLDLNNIETIRLNALGGTDTVTVNNLSGTDVTTVIVDLAGTIGGTAGDAAADRVIVNGTNAGDTIAVTGSGTSAAVSGLAAQVTITNAEGVNDALIVNGLGGNDTISATALPAGVVSLGIDGGDGDDTILGSQGADILLGGAGDDTVTGDGGNDSAFLGAGNDRFFWSPGDGNDTIEGQDGTDALLFDGSNASENINILANGGRVSFLRDIAAITMDMNDVERITFNALGGSDNVVLGDMSGTDVDRVTVNLGGDGVQDRVTANASNGDGTITVATTDGTTTVSGIAAELRITGVDAGSDLLTINGLGGDDIIDASGLTANLFQFTVNGGLGNDVFTGSGGADLFTGGDGNDVAFMGGGKDTFVWNPGDDNDTVEGQGGTDTLLFNASNVAETINILANGGRVTFFRDVANVTMDLNDVERITFNAFGGADNIVVGDLSGTDMTRLTINLAGVLGGTTGDGAIDAVTVNGSDGADTIEATRTGGMLTVTGLPELRINQFELGVDRLTVQAGGGNDVIRSFGDGSYFGGTGDDLVFAGLTSASEIIDGGDGVDTLDTRTWDGLYVINMVTGATNYSGESFTNFENLITGNGDDTITATSADNSISTNGGTDLINAGDGNDTLNGGDGDDTLNGDAGNDTASYAGSSAAVTVSLAIAGLQNTGGAGNDTLNGIENLTGGNHNDTLTGNSESNTLRGGDGDDTLEGGGSSDVLRGDGGSDELFGNGSGDILRGGAGRDFLTGNGGADIFDFNAISESRPGSANRDQILDFDRGEGDEIDLSGIDANTKKSGDQAFKFIGNDKFSETPGELRFKSDLLQGDVNGDGKADFEIRVIGSNPVKADFIL
jgi:Ca2+-binding RTX toxin-like protein